MRREATNHRGVIFVGLEEVGEFQHSPLRELGNRDAFSTDRAAQAPSSWLGSSDIIAHAQGTGIGSGNGASYMEWGA